MTRSTLMKLKKFYYLSKILISLLPSLLMPLKGSAQDIALKTNLLSDAVANATVGAEMTLTPRWTVQAVGSFNFWDFADGAKRWKHWVVMPEARYWFCDAMGGHFVAAHVFGGQYNIGGLNMNFKMLGTDFGKLRDHRFQGWFGGVGVGYGYAWELSKHWNVEAEIGVGWSYTRYDEFRCVGCGKRVKENQPHNYVGPTKAAINLVYIF